MVVTLASLRRLVAQGEGASLEFKRSTGELREGIEALCGMLNGTGRGRVLFGISGTGEIVGQMVTESTQRDIANASRRIEPAADVKFRVVPVRSGQAVVIVEAVARGAGPFTFEGRGYMRVGNTTQRMSHPEFDRRVAKRLEDQTPWDRCVAPDWRIRDLDRNEIHRTIEDAVEAKRLTGVLGEKPEVVLRRLELVADRGVTRAGAILFGKEGGPGYPMGEVRLARFRGVTLFDDRLEIWSTGTLPGGLTPEKLKGTHESILRNRLIAEVFYRRGLIERGGRGTNKILAEAKKIGCAEPEFEEIAGAFVVRFWPALDVERHEVREAKLTERQTKALEFIANRGPCRLADIVARFGGKVSERTVQRDLDGLRRQGFVQLEGVGRGARYSAVKGHPE